MPSRTATRPWVSNPRFSIAPPDDVLARDSQVVIDVMRYALKQETVDNETSSGIGCGVCATVCPMVTLSFSADGSIQLPVVSA